MSIKFREFSHDNDYNSQRQLFNLAFPETIGTSTNSHSHYQWKFYTNPHPSKSFQFVCHEEGALCGSYAALPYLYVLNGQQALCGMVCDVMTHPNKRGKGVFTKLGDYSTSALASKGVDFTSGYPIRPEVIPGHLKVGWFIGFKAPMYINFLKVNSFFKKTKYKFFIPVFNIILSVINWLVSKPPPKEFRVLHTTREQFFSQNKYEDFFERWSRGQKNFLLKTVDFLKWRTNAPETEYFFTQLFHHEKLIGLAIARATELKGISTLAVLDLMMDPAYTDHTTFLFSNMRQLAGKKKCDVIVIMINNSWSRKYRFLRNFFIKTPAVFSIIFKILNNNFSQEEFKKSENWHLTWLDSDDL